MISSVLLILLEVEIVFSASETQLRRREKRMNRGDDIYTQMRTFLRAHVGILPRRLREGTMVMLIDGKSMRDDRHL